MSIIASASLKSPYKTPASNLERVQAMVADELRAADAFILNRIRAEAPLISSIAQHIIASGGKRIRPLLTLLSAHICGYSGQNHIRLAAAVECIHTATLLHDDVVDESALRRGLATANEVFGNKASVLVGDFLFAQSFVLMVESGSLEALRVLSTAATVITRGEVLQLATEGNLATTEAEYLEVIRGKTAALFSAACEVGAVIAATPQYREVLCEYGDALGMAFQLVDDALDYSANQQQLGKTIGDDFREGKLTMPVLIAFAAGSLEEKIFWTRTMSEKNQTPEDFQQACILLTQHQAVTQTFEKAKQYCNKAAQEIATFPAGEEKDALLEIVDFCTGRMY